MGGPVWWILGFQTLSGDHFAHWDIDENLVILDCSLALQASPGLREIK